MTKSTAANRPTGHRFQAIDPRPYMRMGTKPPATCAYCGKLGGDPNHNTQKDLRS